MTVLCPYCKKRMNHETRFIGDTYTHDNYDCTCGTVVTVRMPKKEIEQ